MATYLLVFGGGVVLFALNCFMRRYWGVDSGPVLSVWLALDDSLKENGALLVIPGTTATHLHVCPERAPLHKTKYMSIKRFFSSS